MDLTQTDLRYAAFVADELLRRQDTDPLRKFEAAFADMPHPKQETFYRDDETREVMLVGSNRTGKTKVAAARAARRVRSGAAKYIWIVSPSASLSRQNIAPVLFDSPDAFIPREEIETVRQVPDYEVIGKDGWRIVLKSSEQGRDKFAGAAVDEIIFDEPPTWPVYNECAIRFAAGKQCLLRMAATLLPGVGEAGGVCQWLWAEKIEPWLHKASPSDFKLIQVSMSDNPYITPEQLEMAKRLYPADSLDRRIRINGELLPGLAGARCYAAFERRIHVSKTASRESINPIMPLYLGVDVNVNPLCAVIMQPQGQLWRVLDEFMLRPGSLPELGEQIRERYGSHRHDLVLCGDAMGTHRHAQTGGTDYEVLLAALAGGPRVRLAVPPRNPPDRDRVNLVNFMLGGGGQPIRLEVAASCPETIADLEQVLWAVDGSGIRKSKKPDDPYYQRTHLSDALGYVLWAREASAVAQATRPRGITGRGIPSPQYGFARAM